MADEFLTQTLPPPVVAPLPRRRTGLGIATAALIAFVLGAGGVGYVAWRGLAPFNRTGPALPLSPAPTPSAAPRTALPVADPAALAAQQDTLEGRMAALEQRLDSLDLRAESASGNAARAEALLVAFAARRALDRGSPLGYIEDQLRLRFGDSQPNAVATVIDAGREPVTLDQLLAGLDSLAPTLTEAPADTSAWTRMKRQLSSLFVIRRDASASPAPQTLLGHARVLLEAGKTADAIAELRHLPGAAAATDWFAAARRYDGARRALDVLETTAMLGTHGLKDARGAKVTDPSPIAPAPEAEAPAR